MAFTTVGKVRNNKTEGTKIGDDGEEKKSQKI